LIINNLQLTINLPMFENRQQAGEMLAQYIAKYIYDHQINPQDVVVAFMPRGGLPIANEVAKVLKVPVFAVLVKKLAPFHKPEYGFGAIAPDGTTFVDNFYMKHLGVNESDLSWIIESTLEKIKQYQKFKIWDEKIVKDKIVFLVDDGIATGYTAVVASKYLKNLGAKKVILAVPVCPARLSSAVVKEFDDIICLNPIYDFYAVGQGYLDFHQITDEEYMKMKNDLIDSSA